MLLAGDTAPIDMLCAALAARGLSPAPLFITSLKDREADAFLRDALARLDPALIVTMTAFAAGGGADQPAALDAAGVPVLQVISATTKRAAWRTVRAASAPPIWRCMWCCPSLTAASSPALSRLRIRCRRRRVSPSPRWRAGPSRIASPWSPIASPLLFGCARLPRDERRVAVLMPDYPGAKGRTGYAVGLDVPASVIAALGDLAAAGYAVSGAAQTPRACSMRSCAGRKTRF